MRWKQGLSETYAWASGLLQPPHHPLRPEPSSSVCATSLPHVVFIRRYIGKTGSFVTGQLADQVSHTHTRVHRADQSVRECVEERRGRRQETRNLDDLKIPHPIPQPATKRDGFVMFWEGRIYRTIQPWMIIWALRKSGTTWSAVQLYLHVNSIVTLWEQLVKCIVPDFFITKYRLNERTLFWLLIVY